MLYREVKQWKCICIPGANIIHLNEGWEHSAKGANVDVRCKDDCEFDFFFCTPQHSDREPRCSVDELSVSVCLIGCLGGILTEFQLEFI